MSCYHPHYALDLGIDSDTGKKKIKFLPRRMDSSLQQLRYKYGEDSVLSLPCGHCVGCVLDYAKEWAVRCSLEAIYYPNQTWFITLTYDQEHYDPKLTKEPLQKFIKAIRNDGYKVRYFGCGEKGGLTFRNHFHVLLFGLPVNDLKLYKKTKDGYLFTSKFVSSFWNKGFVTVAHGTFKTAGYIARYCMKKRLSKDEDEFIIMSKRPGIGQRYFEEHSSELTEYDNIVGNFGSSITANIPRYFDKLAERYGIDISFNKAKRIDLAKQLTRSDLLNYCYENEEQLLEHKEILKKEKVRYLPRGL